MPGFLKADFLAWKSCDTSVPPCDLQFGRKVIPHYSPKWMQVSQVFQTRRICGMGFHSSETYQDLSSFLISGLPRATGVSKSWNCILWTWMFYKLRKQPRYELRWRVGCLTCWIFKPEKKNTMNHCDQGSAWTCTTRLFKWLWHVALSL